MSQNSFINKSPMYLSSIFNLNKKVVVLTGGMGRLGTEFARALTGAGARVAIFDTNERANASLERLYKKKLVDFYKVDVTKESEVIEAINRLESKWQTPTILINNAGWKASPNSSEGAGEPFVEYSIDLWEKVFRINTMSAAICSKIIGKKMISNKNGGSIINIVSQYALVAPDQRVYEHKNWSGKKPFVKDAAYGASKAALIALTRDLAVQWAPFNIRVNALALGGVSSIDSDPEFVKNYSARVPLGRMASVEEYNGAVIFLASEAASYVTGATIVIDGGWTAW